MEGDIVTIKLHYLDKPHPVLLEIGKSINRSLILVFVLSAILLANIYKVTTVGSQLEILGVSMDFASWVFPFVVCWGLTLVYIHLLGLIIQDHIVVRIMLRIYSELDYNDPSFSGGGNITLSYPNILTGFEGVQGRLAVIVLKPFFVVSVVLFLFTPIFVQLMSIDMYVKTAGLLNWMSISFIVATAVMVIYFTIFVFGKWE